MTDDTRRQRRPGERRVERDAGTAASRVIVAPPERVYAAFVAPDALSGWMYPPGARCEVHHVEAEEGGTYRITMCGETPDGEEEGHTSGGTFEVLVPGERIVQTEAAETDDPGMAVETTVTITFEAVDDGTGVTAVMALPAEWPDDGIAGWEVALGNPAARLEG